MNLYICTFLYLLFYLFTISYCTKYNKNISILVEVQVRFNNVDYSLKILKKKLQREGVFKTIREKRHHEKPSEKKLRKSIEARKRKHKTFKKAPGASY